MIMLTQTAVLLTLVLPVLGFPAKHARWLYNTKYPLSDPVKTSDGVQYRIGIISDLDQGSLRSQGSYVWKSYFKLGSLTLSPSQDSASIEWDDNEPTEITSGLSGDGRGMELSELCTFNGKILTVDDKTGVVSEVANNSVVIPWEILNHGNGRLSKGFKGEWMTVKDGTLWLGSHGRDIADATGKIVNQDYQWVKKISPEGFVEHVNWADNYNAMRVEGGFTYPGFMLHETGIWSDVHKNWFFLPRVASKELLDMDTYLHKCTNLMFRANEDFSEIKVSQMGPLNLTHGFTSAKFVPYTNDNLIIALKAEELGDDASTYITVISLDGRVIVNETKVSDDKYEGIEFI